MATEVRPGAQVAVFARAPNPGEVKTRLIPALGAQGAAALHRALVTRAIATAVDADIGPVRLWCAGDAAHAFFAQCAGRFGVAAVAQCEGDLGARMRHAFESLLGESERALLIGSDIPALTPAYLRAADAALAQGHNAVLGPAEDGGYVLIGLRRVAPELFARIGWGGPQVLAQTRARLARLKWSHVELTTLWDVDRPEDLQRGDLPELVASIRQAPPEA